jgi:seryl-tRNA synthetase
MNAMLTPPRTPASAAATAYLAELVEAGLLIPSGVPGLLGRSGTFEAVVAGLEGMITRLGAAQAPEVMRFPPAMSRRHFETSGYMRSFPQLVGTIHCFCGDERAHRALLHCIAEGEDWTAEQQASEAVLTPAACYPVYPAIAARGVLPAGGVTVDVSSGCFRHEPSDDPARMQSFRQREYVRIGPAAAVQEFQRHWMEQAAAAGAALGLPAGLDVANDPFFGRAGRLKADSQREQALKFELLIPVGDPMRLTACMSVNYHQDLFGHAFGLRCADGAVAHTACIGFGLERLALALFRHHGFDPKAWPAPVRQALAG